jgi:hypothetical protein
MDCGAIHNPSLASSSRIETSRGGTPNEQEVETMTTVVRSPRGSARREVDIAEIQIPDLWNVAMDLKERKELQAWVDSEMVLDCWHLAHDLLEHIQNTAK